MPKFGKRSKERLATCDQKLQDIMNEVIKHVDCSVLEGHRSQERQDKLFEEGKTKVKYPNGRHNAIVSRAVDITPYPVDWDDRELNLWELNYVGVEIGIWILKFKIISLMISHILN